MTKKLLSILIAIVMVISIAPVAVFAEDDILNYLTYEIDNGKVTITNCDKLISGDVVIPDTIDGYPVTSIFEAFMECDNITSTTLPDSVNFISEGTFSGCDNLRTVNFGNGITRIEQFLFYNCVSLESINIPDSVTEIGLAAFSNCINLKTVKIGQGLSMIDTGAFESCTSLIEFIVDEENINLSNDENGVLYSKDKTALIKYPAGKTESTYKISEGVVSIDCDAFWNCSNLKCIEVPASTTRIYYETFEGTDIEKITFKNKDCVIDFNENTIPPSAVIYGYTGSIAEVYAKTYGREFVVIDKDLFSAFIRFFESFLDFIKSIFNYMLRMFLIT